MKLCLSCYHLSAASAGDKQAERFCPGCGRTYGCRICDKGHVNPSRHSQRCSACGSTQLSEPTAYLPLGRVPRLLTLLAVVLLFRWAFHHPSLVLCGAWRLGTWLLAVLTGTPPNAVQSMVARIVGWLLLLLFLSFLLPREIGKGLRQGAVRAVAIGARMVARVALFLWRTVIAGKPPEKPRKKSR